MPSGPAGPIDKLLRELGFPSDYAAKHALTLQAEVDETWLVEIDRNPTGKSVRLVPAAATAWQDMRAAALHDGIILLPHSGFRSIARQENIIRAKLSAGQPLEAIVRVNTAPGYSEHHTGRAVDIGAPGEPPLEQSFADTMAYRWLKERAGGYGFHLSYPPGNPHGIAFEPWHWCWHPAEDAPPARE